MLLGQRQAEPGGLVMSKKVVVVLSVIALILALIVAGAVGFLWYRDTHVFVEG